MKVKRKGEIWKFSPLVQKSRQVNGEKDERGNDNNSAAHVMCGSHQSTRTLALHGSEVALEKHDNVPGGFDSQKSRRKLIRYSMEVSIDPTLGVRPHNQKQVKNISCAHTINFSCPLSMPL